MMKRLLLTAVAASLLSSAFLISVPAAQAEEAAYKLVLLRHGESQWSLEKRFTGWSDVDLTDKGRAGAVKAGEIMKGAGVNFDEVHTSKLNRAIETAQLAQKGMSAQWLPLQKYWRLNERCYGDLEGKKREDVAKEVGDDQVKIWRRSFDVPPPPLAVTDARSPIKDPRYADLDPRVITASESLKDVIARIGPYWTDQLRPAIKSGKTVLVVGHSTNLRALSAWIEPNLDPKALQKLVISLKYANGLRNGANSDTHRCKQLTEHGEERCIKLREVAGFSAVRTIFQIVGPRKILHCLLGK